MANFMKDLATAISQAVGNKTVIGQVDKEDLLDIVNMQISELNMLVLNIKMIGAAPIKTLTSELSAADKSKPYIGAYKELLGKMDSKVSGMEKKEALSAFQEVGEVFVSLLTAVSERIDGLVTKQTVTIYNTKLSHLVVLGMVAEAEKFINYSMFMITGIVSDLVIDLNSPAKYRLDYLNEESQNVANIMSRVVKRTGAYNFDLSLDQIKKQNNDILLVDDVGRPNTAFIQTSKMNNTTVNLITSALSKLGIFRIPGEIWENLKKAKYERMKKEREWFKSHVELLILRLQNVDKNSPEYIKMTKVIQQYEDIINQLDAKIAKYEAGK